MIILVAIASFYAGAWFVSPPRKRTKPGLIIDSRIGWPLEQIGRFVLRRRI